MILALIGCGDRPIAVDEQAPLASNTTDSETSVEPASRPKSRPATDEEIDIALWGGPLIEPLQKWRPGATEDAGENENVE